MKSIVLSLLFASLAALVAADDLATPHITVSGTAITEATPDRLVWSLELKNTGPDLAKVAEKHSALSATVLKTIEDFGVPDKDVQTSRMEFGENMVYRTRSYVKEGYVATTSVTFKLSDLGRYNEVWTRLAAISGLAVKGAAYDLSQRIELQKQTRLKALHAAREKAGVMAAALDSKIGEPLVIAEDLAATEGWSRGGNLMLNNGINQATIAPADAENPASIAPGTLPIRIRVTVTFRLVNEAR